MKERRFGRTGHLSTVAIFGAAALWQIEPGEADKAIQKVLDAGINHFDVAPSYGQAEEHLGRWMPEIRNRIFLGCKTMERTRSGARAELERSLERMHVSAFDLYQLHAVTNMDELNAATAKGGALEGVLAARDEELTQHIGITSHGYEAPSLLLEALRRFEFDSILFPFSFIMAADADYRSETEELLNVCTQRGVGVMVIKSIARAPWGDRHPTYAPWYEPFNDAEMIQQTVNFALSQPVTGICTVSDVTLLPLQVQACENLREMDRAEQDALIARSGAFEPLWKAEEQ